VGVGPVVSPAERGPVAPGGVKGYITARRKYPPVFVFVIEFGRQQLFQLKFHPPTGGTPVRVMSPDRYRVVSIIPEPTEPVVTPEQLPATAILTLVELMYAAEIVTPALLAIVWAEVCSVVAPQSR
tara:strand:+ start:118 stop:495 length:378 start_codon:yes stop_codon:yes gene_type:complete